MDFSFYKKELSCTIQKNQRTVKKTRSLLFIILESRELKLSDIQQQSQLEFQPFALNQLQQDGRAFMQSFQTAFFLAPAHFGFFYKIRIVFEYFQ